MTERFFFPNGRGQRLAAKLERPEGEPAAWVLCAHGFTGTKDQIAVARLARALARRGAAAVRFDFTGLGESEGDFSETNFTTNVEDLLAAAAHMRAALKAPLVLLGHSFGGAAALAAAGRVPEARAVAAVNAPSSTAHLAGKLPEGILARGAAKVRVVGRDFEIRRQFLEDLARHDIEGYAARLDKTLLVLHSLQDDVVPAVHGLRLFEAARGPRAFTALEGADHFLTDRRDAEYAAEVLAAWIHRHIG